jgi:group II intron reverse transcriptase/maturase
MGSPRTGAIDARSRESDCPVVPTKFPNRERKELENGAMANLNGHEGGNAGDGQGKPKATEEGGKPLAEGTEGRGRAKGNANSQNTDRTQSRGDVQRARERIREVAEAKKEVRFTALLHHVYSIEALREAYLSLKRDAAAGVDGETWRTYGEQLEANLRDLSGRLQRGAYRAKPVRRVFIPKADGRQRPLGVTTLEDKLVQRALVTVLTCIYEADFLGFSYGFRPGREPHHALDALCFGIERKKVNWVLDADIRGFFDAIDHEWLVKFVERRVADKRVVRLIQKWLNAGVLVDGKRMRSEVGTPQGGGISPLLANIYLHYVFDLWARDWRRQAQGDVIVVRYADDFIVGFQHEREARQFLAALRDRLAEYGLELHPDKTRLIEFGARAASDRDREGRGKPETFDFLGFTHVCGKTRDGRFAVVRQTAPKRMRAKLHEVKAELWKRLHHPVPEVGRWLASVIRGHIQYYAVPRNFPAVQAFCDRAIRHWKRTLNRRSQTSKVTWKRMRRLVRRWIPCVRIVHPYPSQRPCLRTYGRSPVW